MNRIDNKKPIPILFVLPTLGTGGSERVVFNLCLHLDRHLFSPVVAAFRGGTLKKEMIDAGIPVHVLNRCGGVDLRLVLKLIYLIHSYQVRVVNSHHFVSLFYAFVATRLMGVPIIHTEHSRWEMEGLRPFWNRCFKFFLLRIEFVNAVSHEAFLYLRHIYCVKKKKAAFIPNGIDINLFKRFREEPITRASLGLDSDDIIVGNVGNFRKEKNQKLLVRAVSIIKDTGTDIPIKAIFVGDGPYRAEVQSLATELGLREDVIFLGTRTDVPRLYSIFDIYCLPSRFEGLPLTLLEAMAAGVPVIGTDVLGIREIIRNNENGILVTDNSPQQLAVAILNLAKNAKSKTFLSENGFQLVSKHYSLENFVGNYELLFQRLTGKRL